MSFFASIARSRRLARGAALGILCASTVALAACSSSFGDDEMPAATGSAFSQALFKDYSDLATQAAALPAPLADEDDGFFSPLTDLFDDSETPGELLNKAFDTKAQLAAQGSEPAPEAAPDATADALRQRLVKAVTAGKEQFPEEFARAQADYDCWVLYGAVPSAQAASQDCRTQLAGSLPHLEQLERPAPPPPPPPPPAPVAPPPVAAADYTVYFDFDSWTLTAEDLSVLTQVINTARAGGQAHISVTGHTDTSGSADYNQKLSVHRANVVVEALVDMGARRAAIKATGVGETDLAVQTADGIKEAKNRRAVIGLQP